MYSENELIEQLKSWEKGYISPSAQRVIYEARVMIEEYSKSILDRNHMISALRSRVNELESALAPFADPDLIVDSEHFDEAAKAHKNKLSTTYRRHKAGKDGEAASGIE